MSGDDRRDEEAERWDGLVSADLDDALSPEERAALHERLARDPSLAARAERFRRVDEALRTLADEPIDAGRLEASWSRLRSRLEREAEATARARSAPRWPITAGIAAAAVLVLAVWLPRMDPGDPPREDRSIAALEAELGEDLVIAIGYGDALSEVGSIPNEDFAVIERLDLLDYLLAQQAQERG